MADITKPQMRGMARVAFRSLQPTIEAELKEGWTAKSIYERHSEKLSAISYPQFVRYCRTLREPGSAATSPTPESTEGKSSARNTIRDFDADVSDPARIAGFIGKGKKG